MIIYCRLLISSIIISILLVLVTSCSLSEWVVYHPDMNQGNYLSSDDIAKIKKGMTQEQIIYILGTAILKDPFGESVWYYIFRQQVGHKKVKQQTLTLTFNLNGILTDIKIITM